MPAADAGPDPAADPGAGEDSALLAVPPGSRNAPRLTPGSKGKAYHPVKTDKRKSGARSRSYASKYSKEKSSSAIRNVMPAHSDIKSLIGMDGVSTGIYEQQQSTYKLKEISEEEKLFHVNDSLRGLIEGLESNTDIITENQDESKAQ